MTYFDGRIRARDAAVRLHDMLREVRGAPKDARDFLVFDKSDEWKALGVGDDQIGAFDLTHDGALDDQIAQAAAVARALGHVDEEDDEMGSYEVAQVGPLVPPPRNAGQRFLDAYNTARRSTFSGASGIAARALGSTPEEREAIRAQQAASQARRDALDLADPPRNADGGILGQGLASTADFAGGLLGRLSSAEGVMDASGALMDAAKQVAIDRALAYGEQSGGGRPRREQDYGEAERWGLRGRVK